MGGGGVLDSPPLTVCGPHHNVNYTTPVPGPFSICVQAYPFFGEVVTGQQ